MKVGDLVKIWKGRYLHEGCGDDFSTGVIVGEEWYLPADDGGMDVWFVPVIVDGMQKDIDPRYIEAIDESR